jgi:anti-sigma factor RsiW
MASILDCKKIQPLLSEYADGALDEATAWDVKMHVSSCAVCAKITQDFAATTRLLQSAPVPTLSADFEARLTRRLADEALRPRPLTPWQRVAFAVRDAWNQPKHRPAFATGAALALLAPVAFLVTRQELTPRVPTSPTPAARAANAGGETTGALDEMWRDHQAYDSSEPFSNPSGLLPITTARASGDL